MAIHPKGRDRVPAVTTALRLWGLSAIGWAMTPGVRVSMPDHATPVTLPIGHIPGTGIVVRRSRAPTGARAHRPDRAGQGEAW